MFTTEKSGGPISPQFILEPLPCLALWRKSLRADLPRLWGLQADDRNEKSAARWWIDLPDAARILSKLLQSVLL